MKGKTHMALGIASATMINNDLKNTALFIPFVILGSLLPDIDCNKKSLIKSSKIITLFAVSIVGYLYLHQNNKSAQLGIISTLIVSMIYSKTKHRTISHSLIGLAVLIPGISLISPIGSLFFILAYSTHLVFDSLTISGVPFLYPFIKDKYGLRICRASGSVDMWLRVLSILVILYFSILK